MTTCNQCGGMVTGVEWPEAEEDELFSNPVRYYQRPMPQLFPCGHFSFFTTTLVTPTYPPEDRTDG